jgi:hypothetical protein
MLHRPPLIRSSALLSLVALSACTGASDFVPCEEDGTIGNVYYVDGTYQLADGSVYAEAGDRPFDLCSILLGQIILNGVIPHFEDFDPFIEIGGFFDAKYDTPDPPIDSGFVGGYIKGFPNLRRITHAVYDTSSLLGDGPSDGGFYLDGFEHLEFVKGDFTCGGSDSLGTELRVVTGMVGCPTARLSNLEHAGELRYRGGRLPSLRTLGELRLHTVVSDGHFELPLLEEVGAGYEGESRVYSGDLLLGGLSASSLDISALKFVRGTLQVMGFLDVPMTVSDDERGPAFREMLSHVENEGRRLICNNGPNDPCPSEDTCEVVHGEGAIECCNDPWPICLEQAGD